MKKRFMALLMASALCLTALTGCGVETDSPSNQNGTSAEGAGENVYRVGFVNIDNADPNCYAAMQNFVKAVESDEFKAAVGAEKVEALTADSAKDIEKQTTNVETLLNKGVDMMFIIGVDTSGNTMSVEACNQEGVPVFMVGTEATGGDWKFVGFNEVELGKKQGAWCAANLPENTNICYLEGTPGREAAVMRKQGFEEGISSRSDLKILSSQTGEFETAAAMQVTEDWIQTYGDKIGCIVSADSMMIIGAAEALKAAGMNEQVTTCGVMHLGKEDGYMIADGDETYAVFVSWPSIGTLCADIAQRIYAGETIDQQTYIELTDVTSENYDAIVAAQ
ncbi:sugar ABC transporter substrate-binding protein [Butyricicoccus sp. Marseille-Q5471]|uniref:sugar ABC transporter substrate-binding protein n=1 Tax=Butyricicoccus sp. Marseille-Q5471 TaxID=3039493 RepID=UPI0024BBF5BC|nr:sugar ABC transporter substrate-binding protein [Butyricicoccus sp. Marseille-Q5471]